MPEVLEAYDRALHDAPAPSVQMAQRLLAAVRRDIESGRFSRDEAHQTLLQLYDLYEANDQDDELNAVADVLDSFDGWSPTKAAI